MNEEEQGYTNNLAAAQVEIERLTAENEQLRTTLTRASVVLSDWLKIANEQVGREPAGAHNIGSDICVALRRAGDEL